MIWHNAMHWLGLAARVEAPPPPEFVLAPAAFRRALARERVRADRANDPLCLATFDFSACPSEAVAGGAFNRLAEIARGRLRLTDELGRLETGHLGVLLPHTDPTGAWKVADDLLALYGDDARPAVDVYAYTSHRGLGDDESSRPVLPLEGLLVQPLPAWKRAVDVAGAGLGLFLLTPLLAATAAAVWITSPGPILFTQERQALGGRAFTMYKFRSMQADAELRKAELLAANEQDGPAFKLANDPRLTPIGNFLRRTAIDELPQLWNVLTGDMTLVGPRPLEHKEQGQADNWQRRRLDVTPGLTCIWQVEGGTHVSFADWMRMDIRYLTATNPWSDLTLIARTAWKLVGRVFR